MADLLGYHAADSTRPKGKSAAAFRTISEVATVLDVPQHVLRFWETRFPQIKPLKRGGGRRYYRPEDVALLHDIRRLLYSEGYTIKGVQRLMRDGMLKAGRSSTEEAANPPSVAPIAASSEPMEKAAKPLPEAACSAIRAAIGELENIRNALLESAKEQP